MIAAAQHSTAIVEVVGGTCGNRGGSSNDSCCSMYQIRSGPAPSRGHDSPQPFGAGTSTTSPGIPSGWASGSSPTSGTTTKTVPRTTRWTYAAPLSEPALCKAGRQADRQADRKTCRQPSRVWQAGRKAGRHVRAVAPSPGQFAAAVLSLFCRLLDCYL